MGVESVLECLHGEGLVDDPLFMKCEVDVYIGYNKTIGIYVVNAKNHPFSQTGLHDARRRCVLPP